VIVHFGVDARPKPYWLRTYFRVKALAAPGQLNQARPVKVWAVYRQRSETSGTHLLSSGWALVVYEMVFCACLWLSPSDHNFVFPFTAHTCCDDRNVLGETKAQAECRHTTTSNPEIASKNGANRKHNRHVSTTQAADTATICSGRTFGNNLHHTS
jgi:hypothetical protein